MRARFGLPLPERRVGLSAHDFAQAFAAPEVVLTRATRVEGTPSVASRWLLRLENLLPEDHKIPSGNNYLYWYARLDAPAEIRPVPAPAPRPPLSARPRRLPVTEVETLIRDPYAVYARRVLGLKAPDPIDADPGAAERGSFIHLALDRFVREHAGELPEDAVDRLLELGREAFGKALARPGVRAFWWPRFERVARWFVDEERRRRARGVRALRTEVRGELELPGREASFTLSATADRIDRLPDGGLAILDYKTGAAVAELAYVRLTGREPAGEVRALPGDPAELAGRARLGLEGLVAAYGDPATPYLSRPRPMFVWRSGRYDHLARVKEWSSGLAEGE
jgi:ATP-dependent helicase/nuclease subunit B